MRSQTPTLAQQLCALQAHVEQLGNHRQRDRVGELAHQLDRLTLGQRLKRGLDGRHDARTDPLHRPGGEEAPHSCPQPGVGRGVAHQHRVAQQPCDGTGIAVGGQQLGALARVRAPLVGAAQNG